MGLLSVEPLAPDAIVLVNDAVVDSEKLIQKFADLEMRHVPGDFAQQSVLRKSNVSRARSVIILATIDHELRGADERALRAALAIRSLAPEVAIVVELVDHANEWHLRIADADDVVVVSEHLPFLLASAALTPGLPRMLTDLLTHASGASITRAALPVEYVGRRFVDLAQHYRNQQCAILIGFVKSARPSSVVLNPADDYRVQANDLPIIIPHLRRSA
jgi:voltage-gated potassium channel